MVKFLKPAPSTRVDDKARLATGRSGQNGILRPRGIALRRAPRVVVGAIATALAAISFGFLAAPASAADDVYRGVHARAPGGLFNGFSVRRSADRTQVVEIVVSILGCDASNHSFTLAVNIPIVGNRFSAAGIPVPGSTRPRSLDIDGAFVDADGDGTTEQAIGGLSFAAGFSRCNEQWWATAGADADSDGWSDAGERRLGSNPAGRASLPEHALVPTTARATPGPCADGLDNDGDGSKDAAEPDGPDPDSNPDCA